MTLPQVSQSSSDRIVALDHLLAALAECGFDLPYRPVVSSGEYAAAYKNREALMNAFMDVQRDHDVRVRIAHIPLHREGSE